MTGKFLVQSSSKAQTRRGKTYLRLRLFDTTGRAWPAVMWEDKDVPAGVLVDVIVEQEDYNGEAQLNVKALRVLDEKPGDLFLPRTKANVDELVTELQTFINDVRDDNLRMLLKRAAEDPRWRRAPAAMKLHHAYLGGLLEHVVNLCRLATAVSALYPGVRRDLLITAAVLHDIGKLAELASDVNIEYTTDGNLLGHIVIGLLWADAWMTEFNFLDETRRLVRHLIISHHGATQYGSPKPPQLLEAVIFTALDGLDAGVGSALAVIDKAAPGAVWSEETNKYQRIYLGEEKK